MLIVFRTYRGPQAALVAVTGVISVGQNMIDEIRRRFVAGGGEVVVSYVIPVVSDESFELRMNGGSPPMMPTIPSNPFMESTACLKVSKSMK